MYWDIASVELCDTFSIKVHFKDGLSGIVKFEDTFFKGVFSHLLNPVEFAKVFVSDNVVTWAGNLDLAPDAMWHGIKDNHGVWVVK